MKLDLLKKIHERCKSRKDGVYAYSGTVYAVKDHSLAYFYEKGKIYSYQGNFAFCHGTCESWEAQKELKQLLKQL